MRFVFLIRPPQVPIGPKPARLLTNVGANTPNISNNGSYSSANFSNGYRPPGSGVNGSNTSNSRHLLINHQQAATSSNNPVEYYMPNLQFQPRSVQVSVAKSSAHRYPYSSAPSPNNIGLPLMNNYSGHQSVTSYVFCFDQVYTIFIKSWKIS